MSLDIQTRTALRAATVGELAWLDPGGRPDACPATPLLLGDEPAVAFPYADLELAQRVAAAAAVALVVSDDRLTGRGWRPAALTGRPRLVEDRDGALFADRLLDQELRKYPPARVLADSVMLRREHWWYLPRLIVAVSEAVAVPVGARPAGTGELLAVAEGADRLYVDTVSATEDGAGSLRLASLAGRPSASGPALLLGHDFSAPDLERWTPWTTRGWLAVGGLFAVEQRPDRTGLEPPLRLWRRLRRQQRLERACRRALVSPQ
jgi:hypothetical protein